MTETPKTCRLLVVTDVFPTAPEEGAPRGLFVADLCMRLAQEGHVVSVLAPKVASNVRQERFPGIHRVVFNKYYVDELYAATVIAGSLKLSVILRAFDTWVVDGLVNLVGLLSRIASYINGAIDKYLVDGAVNLVGHVYDVASRHFRRLQVGFTQGYAMVMVFGAALLLGIFFVVNL